MLIIRRVLQCQRERVATWVGGAALFATVSLFIVQTANHPSGVVVRSAAEAVTATVMVAPRPALTFLSRALLASPASGTTARARHSWEMANIANPLVDKWVKRFESSLKLDFTAALARGAAYDTMISQKLAARQMPRELLYLAMIESEFKPTARSPVAAVGLWQFMAGTARQFGLAVGRGGDERKDPAKETDAALAYLSQLHDRFGSWYLAAAAYNAGPGAVATALRRVMGKTSGSDADFYRIAARLPAETRNYVPKLIAAARIGKRPSTYGIDGVPVS